MQAWANGQQSLKDIVGYTDEELHAISHMGYVFLMQGKYAEARTLFEGLLALEPSNTYYYRALGVIFHHQGDTDRAMQQLGYAIDLDPHSPHAYVNRAELYIANARHDLAEKDLRRALMHIGPQHQKLARKIYALLQV